MALKLAILGLDPAQRPWLDAVSALCAEGEIELVAIGDRTVALAKDTADVFKGASASAPPAFDDLRLLIKESSPQILLMDRPPNANLEFLLSCAAQEIGILSLGPPVESFAEAQALAHALEPRTRLLYIWPRFADAPALRHAAQADDYVRPIRFAAGNWLASNHAVAKTRGAGTAGDLPVRSLSVLAWDALSTLIHLMEMPTAVYAAIRGTVGSGNSFADLSGAASVTLRFQEDAAAGLTLCDRALTGDDEPRRSLLLWGAGGTVRLTSDTYEFRDAEGQLIDSSPSAPATAGPRGEALATLKEFVRHYALPPSPHRGWPHRLEDIAATMEALVVSHRTGQAESPERFRHLRR